MTALTTGANCQPKPFARLEMLPLGDIHYARVKNPHLFVSSNLSIEFDDKGRLKK